MAEHWEGTLERAKKVRIEGVVYCTEHTCVHDDTLDPYDEGRLSCFDNISGERWKGMVHRRVYAGMRRGDWA
jgi:hypothetical protein